MTLPGGIAKSPIKIIGWEIKPLWRYRVIGEHILYEVGAHLQCCLVFFRWVAVYVKIFPAIAEVGFVAVKAYKTAFVYKPVTFWWLAIMLMYLGEAVRKIKFLVIN